MEKLDEIEKTFLKRAIEKEYREWKTALENVGKKSIVAPEFADAVIHNLNIKLGLKVNIIGKGED